MKKKNPMTPSGIESATFWLVAQCQLCHRVPLRNGYRGFFPGVKRKGRGVNHLPSNAEVKELAELHHIPLWT